MPRTQFTGRMMNQPSTPPAIAPGRKGPGTLPRQPGRRQAAGRRPRRALRPRQAQRPGPGSASAATRSPARRTGRSSTTAALPCPSPCLPGLRSAKIRTARAGVSVMALKAEIIIETAIVRANWRKNWPVMPPMNAQGRNTELSTSVMAMIGPVISSIALIVAVARGQALVDPALDVLHHHDGVVDDDADGQHQAEQRQVVEGEAHQPP